MPAISDPASSEWMTQRQASMLLGRSPTAVQRMGLLQQIRTRLVPGEPVRYHAGDVRRIAGSRLERTGA